MFTFNFTLPVQLGPVCWNNIQHMPMYVNGNCKVNEIQYVVVVSNVEVNYLHNSCDACKNNQTNYEGNILKLLPIWHYYKYKRTSSKI